LVSDILYQPGVSESSTVVQVPTRAEEPPKTLAELLSDESFKELASFAPSPARISRLKKFLGSLSKEKLEAVCFNIGSFELAVVQEELFPGLKGTWFLQPKHLSTAASEHLIEKLPPGLGQA
jgi:hypothetical protein